MIKKLLALTLLIFFAQTSFAENFFTSCRFHFGTDQGKATAAIMAQVDYLTAWAGSGEDYNMGSFFNTCKSNGKTPVVIAYVIAFTGRRDQGLQDCNNGTPDLCHKGANYMRQNMPRILSQYAKYAKGAAQSFGSSGSIIWCMEPDYAQYNATTQEGGGLTPTQAGNYMGQIVDTIRKNCPNSLFSMDISPWNDTTWQKTWFAAMNMSKFTFVNTSGGMSRPDQTYISDTWSTALPTWKWVFKTYGTPLIADADYGTAGGSTGYDTRWQNVSNLSARVNDGVIGVSHYNPNASYPTDITAIRSQIPKPPKCPVSTVSVLPFETKERMAYSQAVPSTGVLEILDLSGRILSTKKVTRDNFSWDAWTGLDVKMRPGAYIVRLQGENLSLQKKMFLW